MKVVILKDTLTPKLEGVMAQLQYPRALLQAIGLRAVAFARDAFTDPSKRPTPWAAKKDGEPATLRYRGALQQSLRLVAADNNSATIGSDRPYAAIHQLGGKTKPHIIKAKDAAALYFRVGAQSYYAKQVKHPGSLIPARPYFPLHPDGRLQPEFQAEVESMIHKHVGLGR
ncbi:MAG TPA: phage virion morphogenesis protein [Kiritimatiellia bacterium]|nr:phage virion morphogenesis protein [Kiritimatiellia bacterium]HMP33202.1 phage virion morphogenesis protein [Kiritimatiellia bacterium]